MSSEIYYCHSCDKVFKLSGPGKKIKCPNCSELLLDMGINDEDYAKLDKQKKYELKIRTVDISESIVKDQDKQSTHEISDNLSEQIKTETKVSERNESNTEDITDQIKGFSFFDTQTVETVKTADNMPLAISNDRSQTSDKNIRKSSFFDLDNNTEPDTNDQRPAQFEREGVLNNGKYSLHTGNKDNKYIEKETKSKDRNNAKITLIILVCIAGVLLLGVGGLGAFIFFNKPSVINSASIPIPKIGISDEAQSVIDRINTIGEVELDDEPIIAECEDAYIALNEEQQAEVNNLNALMDARQKLDELIAAKPIPFSDANWETTQSELIAMLGEPDEEGDNEYYGHQLWYYNVKHENFTGIAKYGFENGKLTRCTFAIDGYNETALNYFETLFSTKYGEPTYTDDYGNKRWDMESVSCGVMPVKLFGGMINILYMRPVTNGGKM